MRSESTKLQSFQDRAPEIKKSDMRKFDGKDPVNWILQMEQYFDLHGVPLLQNVCIASSYVDLDQFLWYKGLCSRKKTCYVVNSHGGNDSTL